MNAVDIIIPCYNYGRYLSNCIRSVLSQEQVSVRVLVIDDASTDESVEIAKSLAAADPRIDCIFHTRNIGHIATYNEGLEWASSDFMLLLSADDLLSPGALSRAAAALRATSGAVLAYGHSLRFTDDIEPNGVDCAGARDATPSVIEGYEFISGICAQPINPIETATAVVLTKAQKRVGSYRAELTHAGDLEMWLRFGAVGSIVKIAAIQAYIRMHQNNMRHRYAVDYAMPDFLQRRLCFKRFFEDFNHGLPDGRRLFTTAERALRREMLWTAMHALEIGRLDMARTLVRAARIVGPEPMLDPLMWKYYVKQLLGLVQLRKSSSH